MFHVAVVSHDSASKECRRRLAEAYELNRKLNGAVSEDDLKKLRRKLDEDKRQELKSKRLKQTLIGWGQDSPYSSMQQPTGKGREGKDGRGTLALLSKKRNADCNTSIVGVRQFSVLVALVDFGSWFLVVTWMPQIRKKCGKCPNNVLYNSSNVTWRIWSSLTSWIKDALVL